MRNKDQSFDHNRGGTTSGCSMRQTGLLDRIIAGPGKDGEVNKDDGMWILIVDGKRFEYLGMILMV